MGTQYYFPKRGDGLPMHWHGEEDRHNIIVLKGSCEVYGPNKFWSYQLKQGAIFHFQDHEYPHEVAAQEDGTVILNLLIYGDKFIHLKNLGNHDEGGIINDSLIIPVPELKPKKGKKK